MRTRHSQWRCSAMLPLLLSGCDGAETPGPEADSASETGDLTGGDAADLPSEAAPEPYGGDPALEDLSPN